MVSPARLHFFQRARVWNSFWNSQYDRLSPELVDLRALVSRQAATRAREQDQRSCPEHWAVYRDFQGRDRDSWRRVINATALTDAELREAFARRMTIAQANRRGRG